MGLEDDKEELLARHRKELKELRGKIQAVKNAVPKGDKKRKKQATEEIAKLESDTDARHAAELTELEKSGGGQSAVSEACCGGQAGSADVGAAGDDGDAGEDGAATAATGGQLTKAQRRKLKKEQEAKEREERLEEASKAAVNSERSVEMRTLTSMLDSLSLKVHQVEADGNCLYHALVYQLNGQQSESAMLQLRRQAANFMLRHRDDFEAFVVDAEAASSGCPVPGEDSFERYCRNVAETSMWGGQLEIQALSRALDRKIVVYQAASDPLTIGDDTSKSPLGLAYHRHDLGSGEHYNAIMAVDSS